MTSRLPEPVRHHLRWYERVRYEDAPFAPWRLDRTAGYLVKYWRKRPAGPADLIARFDRIRQAARADRFPTPDFTLAAVGDILWMRRGYEDFIHPSLAPALAADLTFGNLETPVSPAHRMPPCLPDVLTVNAPAALVETLARSGFDVVSVVNNHCLDRGEAGLRGTLAEVRRAGLVPIEAGRSAVIERRGVTTAFLAFSTFVNRGRGTPPPGAIVRPTAADRGAFLDAVRAARGADLVAVSAHWGYEFEFLPDRSQVDFARELAEAGADIILGHHPHVVQPVEFIDVPGPPARRAVVLYSLGDFAAVLFSLPCRVGVVARVGVSLAGDRAGVQSVELVPTLVHVRQRWRTQVVTLDAAGDVGVPPRRIARARAYLEARTPLRLVAPGLTDCTSSPDRSRG